MPRVLNFLVMTVYMTYRFNNPADFVFFRTPTPTPPSFCRSWCSEWIQPISALPAEMARPKGHGVRNYICHHGHHLYCNGCIDVGGKSKALQLFCYPQDAHYVQWFAWILPRMHILRWFMPDFDWREDRFDFWCLGLPMYFFTVFLYFFSGVVAAFVAFTMKAAGQMDRHQQRTGLCVFEQPSGQSSHFSGHGSRDVEDETCSQPGSGQRYSEVFVATCHHHSGRQHQSKHCCASAAVFVEAALKAKSHQWHLQSLRCKAGHLCSSLFTTAFNYAAEPFFQPGSQR